LAKFGDPYLDLGTWFAKSRRQKDFNFTREQYAVRIIYLAIAHFPTSLGKRRNYAKNSNIWRAPWHPLLGLGPWNFVTLRNSKGSLEQKNFVAEHLKLEEILGGSQNFFGPLISKTGRQIRNFTSYFEGNQKCASTIKSVGKSIRWKFVKNAKERGHKFSSKNSKVRPPGNSETKTASAMAYEECFMQIRLMFLGDKK